MSAPTTNSLSPAQRQKANPSHQLAQEVGGIDSVSAAGGTRRFAGGVGPGKKLAAAAQCMAEELNNEQA